MRAKTRVDKFIWLTCALMTAFAVCAAEPAGMKLQAFLLWGTNDSKPPETRPYNPAAIDIRQRLKDLPLKWTNWFEVNRKDVPIVYGVSKDVHMSDRCRLSLKQVERSQLEFSLVGGRHPVLNGKQVLPKGEMLVLGGNAPNSTAWLVVLKRVE